VPLVSRAPSARWTLLKVSRLPPLLREVRHPDLLGTSGKDESAPVNLMLPSSTLNVGSVGQISSGPSSADRPQNLGAISFIVARISQAIGEIDAPHVDAALLDAFFD